MTELITYRGGSCGDFVRGLLVSNGTTSDNGKHTSSQMHDFTRFAFDMIRGGDDISTVITKIKAERDHAPFMRKDYITSHDYYVFFERYNNADEFFKYIEELDITRILYISVTTDKSLRLRTLNALVKNHSKGYDDYIEHYDKYGIYQLEQYRNEAKIYLDSKRKSDIILELECIYDKEYLRNFLLEHYNWSDSNYDAIYDAYMIKQPRIGD